MLCNNLNGNRIWKRTDICVCRTESPCCTAETITLLINYTPIWNKNRKEIQMNEKQTQKYRTYGAAAAAAKLLQSCPTLCDPMDCSPPGPSVHGIFQARVLEWVAIAFSVPKLYQIAIFLYLFSILLLLCFLFAMFQYFSNSSISSCPQLWSFLNTTNCPKNYFLCQPLHTHTFTQTGTHTNYPWILFTFQIKWQQSLSTKAVESIAPTSFSSLLPSPPQVPAFTAATVGSWLLP